MEPVPPLSDVASNNIAVNLMSIAAASESSPQWLTTAIHHPGEAGRYGAILIALIAVTRSPMNAIAICRSVRGPSADNSFDLSMLDYLDLFEQYPPFFLLIDGVYGSIINTKAGDSSKRQYLPGLM